MTAKVITHKWIIGRRECRLKTEIAMTKQVMFCQSLSFWNFLFRTIETLLIEGVVIFTESLIKINIFLHSCILKTISRVAEQHSIAVVVQLRVFFSIFGIQWYSYYLLPRCLQISMSNPKLYFEEGRTIPWLNEKEQNVK
jgi:hypothetical protein